MPALMLPDKFTNWLILAPARDVLIYHEGHLAEERERTKEMGPRTVVQYIEPQHTVGRLAYEAFKRGSVDLVQRRRKDGVIEYLAIKRKQR